MGPRMYPVLAAASCLAGAGRVGPPLRPARCVFIHIPMCVYACFVTWTRALRSVDGWMIEKGNGEGGRAEAHLTLSYPRFGCELVCTYQTRPPCMEMGGRGTESCIGIYVTRVRPTPERALFVKRWQLSEMTRRTVPGFVFPQSPKSIAKAPRRLRQGLGPLLSSSQI